MEAYGKRYDDVLQPDETDDPDVRGDEFLPIRGHSYGVDVLLRQMDGERFGGWLAYGYSVSAREPVRGGDAFWPDAERIEEIVLDRPEDTPESVLDEGDIALIPEVHYPLYPAAVRYSGGVPVTYPEAGDVLTFVRGHEGETDALPHVDWARLAGVG